jgi:xylitol oxidase
VYEALPFAELGRNFEEVMSAGYSVSLFTTWSGPEIDQVWVKSLATNPPTLFGAKAATEPRHPIRGMPADYCSTQLNVRGSWDERLSHFKMEFTPSSGEELQTEYFVPFERSVEALSEVRKMADLIAPHLHVSEVRSVAADKLWMSPAYQRANIGIHFTWKKQPDAVMSLLPQIESRLEPFGIRPHWAKLTTMDCVGARYPRAAEFLDLCRTHDPTDKFQNAYLQRMLGN